MQEADVTTVDKSDMYSVLRGFPAQVEAALEIGSQAPFFSAADGLSSVVVAGMGGSAIGGDLLKSYLHAVAGKASLPLSVSRSYSLPPGITDKTGVVVSSYSGATEETLAAFEEAIQHTPHVVAITTGGPLAERARQEGKSVIIIPGGLQPRCALGYSFFTLLGAAMRSGLWDDCTVQLTDNAVAETKAMLHAATEAFGTLHSADNAALRLATQLQGSAVAVYSSSDILDSVNLRWRGQLQENSKVLTFGGLLPEMNHNEINGWIHPAGVVDSTSALFLRDIADHPRVSLRFEAMKDILAPHARHVIELAGTGSHLLTRMFYLISLADWTSFYLAVLNGEDPTAIPSILKLKDILSKS